MSGRLHVHLGVQLKERLTEIYGPDRLLSSAVRDFLEVFMHADVQKFLENGDDQALIKVLTENISKLRRRRLQAGTSAARARAKTKAQSQLKKVGISEAAKKQQALDEAIRKAQEDAIRAMGGG